MKGRYTTPGTPITSRLGLAGAIAFLMWLILSSLPIPTMRELAWVISAFAGAFVFWIYD